MTLTFIAIDSDADNVVKQSAKENEALSVQLYRWYRTETSLSTKVGTKFRRHVAVAQPV
jgi:hypothetical protein